jgi:hypothetical protein
MPAAGGAQHVAGHDASAVLPGDAPSALPETVEASAIEVDTDQTGAVAADTETRPQQQFSEANGPGPSRQPLRRRRTSHSRPRNAPAASTGAAQQDSSVASRGGGRGRRGDTMWEPPNAAHLVFLAGGAANGGLGVAVEQGMPCFLSSVKQHCLSPLSGEGKTCHSACSDMGWSDSQRGGGRDLPGGVLEGYPCGCRPSAGRPMTMMMRTTATMETTLM